MDMITIFGGVGSGGVTVSSDLEHPIRESSKREIFNTTKTRMVLL
jgi:hypothetical protein